MFLIQGRRYYYCFILLIIICSCGNDKKTTGGVSAEEALATFTIADGFQIEMIASEPLISDPVDMEIDEYGRMYVVEMHGYPLDKSGSGRVILLQDGDGNGSMDKHTVFRDDLVLPTSIMRWKKGVIVTDAPYVFYLEDADGDGKAERMDTVLSGFALTNPQHNVNTPIYGLDNWIYVAHEGAVSTREFKDEFGDEGKEIIFHGTSGTPVLPKNANGRTIRFNPDKKLLEMASSRSQFGQTIDAWGNRFGMNNSNQGYHEIIASRYFERNPGLVVSDAVQDMSDHLNAAEVFPTTTHPDRQLLTNVGVMTSACGITSYLGNLFPPPYDQNITFIAEPVSNLVHVDILRDSATSFTASRILEHKEFLSSTDSWSRPVNMYVGPDGALYVLDYYRQVIESPEWMSAEAITAGGLYNGSDKGRIFRITPKGTKPAEWTKGLTLGDNSAEQLVAQLANQNGWWRINAQRLLVDRQDKKAVPALTAMAINAASPLGRLHALWTLEGMGELTTDLIQKSLKDSVAGIRQNAIQLTELHLSSDPALANALLLLQNDTDAKVRLQLLLTLGFINTPEAVATRNKLLFKDIANKWAQIAALSASASQTGSLLNAVLQKSNKNDPAYASMITRLTAMIATSGQPEEIYNLIQKGNSSQAASIFEGLAEGLKNRKSPINIPLKYQQMLVSTSFGNNVQEMRAAFNLLKVAGISDSVLKHQSIDKALTILKDSTQQDIKRAQAIDFLSLGNPALYSNELKHLLTPQQQPIIQLATIRTLDMVPGTETSKYLIDQWSVLTPEIREAAIKTFIGKADRIDLLLRAIETGNINANSVGFNSSVGLMQLPDSLLRNRARVIFTRGKEEGKKINAQYRQALDLVGDPLKGKEVYTKNCALCHQVRGKFGVSFGPDLGTIHNWIREDIMANILDPTLSIASGFDLWNAELNSGESVQGIIISETPTAFTLRNNGKADRVINRQDVKTLKAANVSAMPSGLEKNIDYQQMADLLSFLRQN